MKNFKRTAELIRKGADDGFYPGAVFSVGDKNGELFRMNCGCRALNPEREEITEHTLFDLASVTKLMATTMIAFRFLQDGKLNLSDKIGKYFDVPSDKKEINIWNLMTHTSGLPASVRLDEQGISPAEACSCILKQASLYKTGENVTYSCLGYILLGKICEMTGGANLAELAEEIVFKPLEMKNTGYKPDIKNPDIAKTEYCAEQETWLRGIVHDENARFLNGISGNAGCFSNIDDCVKFALMLSNRGLYDGKEYINRELFEESIKNHTPGMAEGRGLGYTVKDRDTLSCGKIFSQGSYGHTGFTGTSVWIDSETSQYAVLLTNRVHPTRENVRFIEYRKTIHDICAGEYREECI